MRIFIGLISLFFLSSCVSGQKLKVFKAEQVNLKFSPEKGSVETQKYTYNTELKYYDDVQLVREKQHGVEFVTEAKVIDVSPDSAKIKTTLSTISKVGTMGLQSMGFPELNQVLSYEFDNKYQVLSVSKQRQGSVFYVPPLPLPKSAVNVGETWQTQYHWIGDNQIPLSLDVVGILKQVYNCPNGVGACSEIEVSGRVYIPKEVTTNLKINSNLRGKYLVENSTGSILWSHVRSEETFVADGSRINSVSCIATVRSKPKVDFISLNVDKFDCDPKNENINL